jgi:hypothetical protein
MYPAIICKLISILGMSWCNRRPFLSLTSPRLQGKNISMNAKETYGRNRLYLNFLWPLKGSLNKPEQLICQLLPRNICVIPLKELHAFLSESVTAVSKTLSLINSFVFRPKRTSVSFLRHWYAKSFKYR